MTPTSRHCSECGASLPADAPRGACPRCLLLRGFESLPPDEPADPRSTVHLVLPEEPDGALPFSEMGDYELLKEIGRGGMGVIYQARQKSLGRLVALKLIRAGALARDDGLARFKIEAAATARLRHPGIVAVHEVGEHAGQPYYSMDFVPGRSLAAALRDGPFAPRRAAECVRAVAEAIHCAHEGGVIHRDLKPANILLDAEGEPRVSDFGLAKLFDVAQASSPASSGGVPAARSDSGRGRPEDSPASSPAPLPDLTLTGAVLGTPNYMPPEQARGRHAEVSARSDVYSLGAILYECLTARPPFTAATPLETIKLVVEQEPMAPRRLNPALPRDLETICLKCLQKDPAQRYGSAQSLAEDLTRWLGDEPIHARPSSRWEHGVKWAKRRPALAALLAVIVVAVAGFVALLLFNEAKVTGERNTAQYERNTAQHERNVAQKQRSHALQQEQLTRQSLYAADMARAWQALENSDYHLAWAALDAYRPKFVVPASAGSAANTAQPEGPADAGTTNAGRLKAELQTDLRGFEWRWLWQRAQGEARKIFPAHLSMVNSVAYSPDGRFVVSAGADGVTKLWDAAQERLLRTLEEPEKPLTTYTDQWHELPPGRDRHRAAFSPDSRTLLTCTMWDLNLWESESGRRLWSFKTTNALNGVVFSPTDPNVALATPHPTRTLMGLLDVAQGRFTAIFTNGRADAVCFTPDGRRFARWDRNLRCIWLQNFPSGKIVASIAAPGLYVEQMAITPDGRTLAACHLQKGPLQLFDLATQQSITQLVGHARGSRALAISPDGRRMASGGNDQAIRLWDLAARREERQLLGHRAPVLALAFSPDGQRLASGGYDGTVRFWNVEPPAPLPTLTNIFGVFAFSPDGHWLVTQDTKAVGLVATARLWELPACRLAQEWETPSFQSAVFTTNGALLTASLGSSNEPPGVRAFAVAQASSPASSGGVPPPVRSRDETSRELAAGTAALPIAGQSPTGEKLSVTFFHSIPSPCSAIALSPDGQFTVTGHTNGTLALWDIHSGRLHRVVERALPFTIGFQDRGIITAVNPLVFSADGHTLAAISFRSVLVKTWTLPELRPIGGRIFGGINEIPLALSPDGRQMALGGLLQGLTINLWDAALSQPGTKLRGHQEFLKVVAYSPDGRTLVSGGRDGLLKLWHLPTEREVATILALSEETNFTFLAFSPDGTWLGASDDRGHLHLFHAPSLAELDQP